MSKMYEMVLTVNGVTEDLDMVLACACKVLGVAEITEAENDEGELKIVCQKNLGGGEDESSYAKEVHKRVWKIVEGHVEIKVEAIYLEDNPREQYSWAQEELL